MRSVSFGVNPQPRFGQFSKEAAHHLQAVSENPEALKDALAEATRQLLESISEKMRNSLDDSYADIQHRWFLHLKARQEQQELADMIRGIRNPAVFAAVKAKIEAFEDDELELSNPITLALLAQEEELQLWGQN